MTRPTPRGSPRRRANTIRGFDAYFKDVLFIFNNLTDNIAHKPLCLAPQGQVVSLGAGEGRQDQERPRSCCWWCDAQTVPLSYPTLFQPTLILPHPILPHPILPHLDFTPPRFYPALILPHLLLYPTIYFTPPSTIPHPILPHPILPHLDFTPP